jgi:hypothetical protein
MRVGGVGTAAMVFLATVAACPMHCQPHPPPSRDCSTCVSTVPRQTVSLLVRAFLPRSSAERRAYAFHAYLLFADRTGDTDAERWAAATAVMRLFSDVRDVKELKLPESKLAILHLPVRSLRDAAAIMRAGDAQALVDLYDYDRVRLIKRDVEMKTRSTLPRVAILGSRVPLIDASVIDPAQLYVVDLERMSSAEVEDRVAQFRDALESPRSELIDLEPTAATRAGGYFKRLGVALGGHTGHE